MTATASRPPISRLSHLRQNIVEARETYGRRSSQAQQAFELLVREAAEAGAPLDGLRRHTENEVERFFAFTIPGPDGHVYWDGPRDFRRNDGKYRPPQRWWWIRVHGSLNASDDLAVKCGERNCINPDHCAVERVRGVRIYWTEQRIIGAIQVAALRLGHTPSLNEWDRLGVRPNRGTIETRFGSWNGAVIAAGLTPNPTNSRTTNRDACLRSIRFVRDLIGHLPSDAEFYACREQLQARGLPASLKTIARHCGSWIAAKRTVGEP